MVCFFARVPSSRTQLIVHRVEQVRAILLLFFCMSNTNGKFLFVKSNDIFGIVGHLALLLYVHSGLTRSFDFGAAISNTPPTLCRSLSTMALISAVTVVKSTWLRRTNSRASIGGAGCPSKIKVAAPRTCARYSFCRSMSIFPPQLYGRGERFRRTFCGGTASVSGSADAAPCLIKGARLCQVLRRNGKKVRRAVNSIVIRELHLDSFLSFHIGHHNLAQPTEVFNVHLTLL